MKKIMSLILATTMAATTVLCSNDLTASAAATTPAGVTMKSKYTSTTNAIRINWKRTYGATGYRVYRFNKSTKKWNSIITIKDPTTTTYRDSGSLKSGTTYKYKVKAYKKANGKTYWGDASSTFSASTKYSKPTSITLSEESQTIYINQSTKLSVDSVTPSYSAKTVKWQTSDKSVATVSSGVVKGVGTGTAVISAVSTLDDSVKAECVVTVEDYGKKTIDNTSTAIVFNVPSNDYSTLNDSSVLINTYSELNEFIDYIKSNYPEYSNIISQMEKYNEEFFNDKALIYNRTTTFGIDSSYVRAEVTSCLKKFNNGKLTAYVKASYFDDAPLDTEIDNEYHTRFNCYFTEVSKADIEDVQKIKLIEKANPGIEYPCE